VNEWNFLVKILPHCHFWCVYINSRKCLLGLSCLSICPHASVWLPLNGFSWILILETSTKICWETPDLVKIGNNIRHITWCSKHVYIIFYRISKQNYQLGSGLLAAFM
jgi:hypothetical protein